MRTLAVSLYSLIVRADSRPHSLAAASLAEDPRGTHAESVRGDVAASVRLLEQRAAKGKVVRETLRVVSVLLGRAGATEAGRKRKLDNLLNGSGGGSVGRLDGGGVAEACSGLSFLLEGELLRLRSGAGTH